MCVYGTLFAARGFVVAESNQLHKDMSCAAYIFIECGVMSGRFLALVYMLYSILTN